MLRARCVAVCALLGVALSVVVGCGEKGPKRQPISGAVKFKGQPVKSGTISFRSEGDGKYVGTGTISEGKYEIPAVSGLPAGKYRVALSYPDPKIPAPRPDEPPGESTKARELLPAKYTDGSLTVEIKDGPNDDVSFDLN